MRCARTAARSRSTTRRTARLDFPNDADWTYLYDVQPDTVEVWNISRLYQPPLPSGSNNDDAIRYWEGWLDRGAKVAATGGSDSHWRSTFAAQGVGQPTTWVFARERTAAGVLEGLRAGHTFISHQPPNLGGPLLFLEGDGKMVGDEVAPGAPAEGARRERRGHVPAPLRRRAAAAGRAGPGHGARVRALLRRAGGARLGARGALLAGPRRGAEGALRHARHHVLPQHARRDRDDIGDVRRDEEASSEAQEAMRKAWPWRRGAARRGPGAQTPS